MIEVPSEVKSSLFGCNNCLYAGGECENGSLYAPHMVNGTPSCERYAYS